ncbi:MAG: hypothetical protein IBJ18_11480 [Phycisphaerales bacterium]|nr:hypothetical protein [Phycisphaerales bacterium]
MAKSRQVIIIKSVNPADEEAEGLPSMGSVNEILRDLAPYNTAPDSPPNTASNPIIRLHGPGLIAELSASADDVRQIMITITDDDFAFPILTRACREHKWTLMDPESGQRLRF